MNKEKCLSVEADGSCAEWFRGKVKWFQVDGDDETRSQAAIVWSAREDDFSTFATTRDHLRSVFLLSAGLIVPRCRWLAI